MRILPVGGRIEKSRGYVEGFPEFASPPERFEGCRRTEAVATRSRRDQTRKKEKRGDG